MLTAAGNVPGKERTGENLYNFVAAKLSSCDCHYPMLANTCLTWIIASFANDTIFATNTITINLSANQKQTIWRIDQPENWPQLFKSHKIRHPEFIRQSQWSPVSAKLEAVSAEHLRLLRILHQAGDCRHPSVLSWHHSVPGEDQCPDTEFL